MKKMTILLAILMSIHVGVNGQCPDNLYLTSQVQIDSFQINYPGCNEIVGDVKIYGNDITNLYGLNNLVIIGGSLQIGNNNNMTGANPILTSLEGLSNLSAINGDLEILGNDILVNLTGLENLTTIGGSLVIGGWWNTWTCYNQSLQSLDGLDNLTSISDGIQIIGGGILGDSLEDISALSNLTSINGDLYLRYVPSLQGLEGLENIDAASIVNLTMFGNNLLSTCDVQSICNYLAAPGGEVSISDNAIGCNSPEEVQDSCEAHAGYNDIWLNNDFLSIFPNPAHVELNITAEGYSIEEIIIYTIAGQQVMQKRFVNGIIDISVLRPGMYIVEVTIDNTRIRQKLLVE